MKARKIVLHPQTREKLKRVAQRCTDADTRVRYRIVIRSSEGWSGHRIARALGCCASTVKPGEAGLIDRREDNGDAKAEALYVDTVRWILQGAPRDFFQCLPTWTKALWIETAKWYTCVGVSKATMSRVLKIIRVRRGRAKPLAPCPWSEARKNRRMKRIHALIDTLGPDEACVCEDEADIDLNPRIGADWTLPRQQRTVMKSGKNVKRMHANVTIDHLRCELIRRVSSTRFGAV